MSNELKDCPFCGKAPLIQEIEPHKHNLKFGDFVMPDHPGCFTLECPTPNCCGMIADTHAELVAAWNRRTVAAPIASAAPSGVWVGIISSGEIDGDEIDWDAEFDRKVVDALPQLRVPNQHYGLFMAPIDGAKYADLTAYAQVEVTDTAIAHQPPKEALTWQKLTTAGQVKKGDYVRFNLCGETKVHQVALILNAGTDKEEIIYHKRNNWYLITSMSIKGEGSQKNVEFLPVIASLAAAGVEGE